MGARRRTGVVLGAVAVLVVALGVAWWAAGRSPGPGSGTASGNVITYDGRTYWVSGERIREAALGASVARGVPYQDTTADLREVQGFEPDAVLAAYLPAQRAGQTGPGWTFVAVDQRLGTDPASDRSASTILEP